MILQYLEIMKINQWVISLFVIRNRVSVLDESIFIRDTGSTVISLSIFLCFQDHVVMHDLTFILIHLESFQKTEKEKMLIWTFTQYHLVS